ncbi:MAG: hypothetical protein A3K19_17560 [Lentisphaerae bacterium RIFOXYB12_FULL_65_16]|nr:MAG: hypothetical protein A3K18_03815 [Lentisphaerae bacterium RIFOXYA12_64_32]OGV91506.1 MAG: hypothetical protein A3K19_17560 [Lentisphaerae bacterium RIFOXYB12_FULL_65_16]
MDTVRIGVIGCGPMGQGLAKAAKEFEFVRLEAASDVGEKVLGDFCNSIGGKPFKDYREMIRNVRLDAAIVASPPFLHREMVEALADAGVHVFCEKPMSTNVADCDAMIRHCEQRNVKLMIGQVLRYHGIPARVRELVKSGVIGAPLCMIVRRIWGGFGTSWGTSWRTRRKESGGNLMEINAHEIDFMRTVCGDVRTVMAVGVRHPHSTLDFPDATVVSMAFKSGAMGALHSGAVSVIPSFGGRVDGDQGGIEFPVIWGEGAGIHVKTEKETKFIPAAEIQVENPVKAELRGFFAALREGVPIPVPGAEGRAAVEIAEAAYRSIDTAAAVALPLG